MHSVGNNTDVNFWTSCVESRIPAIFPGARSVAEASKQTASLDLEIRRIEACVVLAKKRRNMSAPCSRLPLDCLMKVMNFVRDIWPPSRGDSAIEGQNKYVSGWMAVTHVCSAWREFALSTPSLWADLTCTSLNPSATNELLRRSKLLPLTLRFDIASLDDPLSPFWLKGAHTQRLESLAICSRLDTHTDPCHELLPCLAQHEFPCLKYLQLTSDSRESTFALPQAMLSRGQQPRLNSLSCKSYMLVWPSNISFQYIQELRLSLGDSPNPDAGPARTLPTAQELTDVLSSLHSARIIELVDIFPQEGPFPSGIALPNSLRRLVLSATWTEQSVPCAQTWSQLVIPHNTNVVIAIRETEEDHLEVLRGIFAKSRSGFELHPVEMLFGYGVLFLLGSETFKNPCPASPNQILDAGVQRFEINDWNDGSNALFSVFPYLPTTTFHPLLKHGSTRVVHFSLGFLEEGGDDPSYWVETLSGAWQSVERVVLPIIAPSVALLYALARTGHASSSNTHLSPPLLFPLLNTLTLHYDELIVPAEELPVFVNVLIYLIHVRRECGSPIQSLQITASQQSSPIWSPFTNELPITWF